MPSSKYDPNRIPNEQLREAVLLAHKRGEITYAGLASDMGLRRWAKRPDRPSSGWKGDCSFVQRMLGIKSYKEDNGKRYYNKTIQVKYAEQMMLLLGLDPIDVGL